MGDQTHCRRKSRKERQCETQVELKSTMGNELTAAQIMHTERSMTESHRLHQANEDCETMHRKLYVQDQKDYAELDNEARA